MTCYLKQIGDGYFSSSLISARKCEYSIKIFSLYAKSKAAQHLNMGKAEWMMKALMPDHSELTI
jgi:hypothetical protein